MDRRIRNSGQPQRLSNSKLTGQEVKDLGKENCVKGGVSCGPGWPHTLHVVKEDLESYLVSLSLSSFRPFYISHETRHDFLRLTHCTQ